MKIQILPANEEKSFWRGIWNNKILDSQIQVLVSTLGKTWILEGGDRLIKIVDNEFIYLFTYFGGRGAAAHPGMRVSSSLVLLYKKMKNLEHQTFFQRHNRTWQSPRWSEFFKVSIMHILNHITITLGICFPLKIKTPQWYLLEALKKSSF